MDAKDWAYIPGWNEKHLTCSFCGTNKSVKYDVVVKAEDGKNSHVPACSNCLCHMIVNGW